MLTKKITIRSFIDAIKDPYKIVDIYKNHIQGKTCNYAEYNQDYIIDTVSNFVGINRNEISGYFKEALIIYNDIKNKTQNVEGPGIVEVDGIILYILLRATKSNKIVETGVANGATTYYILSAIKRCCGKEYLHSIDIPFSEDVFQKDILRKIGFGLEQRSGILPSGKDAGWLVPEELRDNWSYHQGSSKKILPGLLSNIGNIDMFIHDSDHWYRNMIFEYKISWSHMNKGGLLCSHDILKNNAFDEFINEYKIGKYIKIGNFGCAQKDNKSDD